MLSPDHNLNDVQVGAGHERGGSQAAGIFNRESKTVRQFESCILFEQELLN